MSNYYRLQSAGISINQMREFTSDYSNDAEYIDEYMYEDRDEYEAALAEQREEYDLTICATDDAYEASFGGANNALGDEAEVVVLKGQVARRIYDGVRLSSPSLVEVARFTLGEWRRMQDTGEVDQYA